MTQQQSGFEDDPHWKFCTDPAHEPPTALYVPPGKLYRHVCPGCGAQALLRGDQTRMSA
jgi:hypothetical protein